MIRKLYYDDPLAAAWMAREFGIKFYTIVEGESFDIDFSTWIFMIDSETVLYIHSDSLHIFEPGVGDYYINIGVRKNAGKLSSSKKEAVLSSFKYHGKWPIEIIQRDGKHFFMPLITA